MFSVAIFLLIENALEGQVVWLLLAKMMPKLAHP
jgi:hypothetical protein